MHKLSRGGRVDVDLERYGVNVGVMAELATAMGGRLCCVIKANGYGLGLERLAPVAAKHGCEAFGVVDNADITMLRDLGLKQRIFRLRHAYGDEVAEVAHLGVEELVSDVDHAEIVASIGRKRGHPIPVHLDVDIGIGRTGCYLPQDLIDVGEILAMEGLKPVAVMSHFSSADIDTEITKHQYHMYQSNKALLHHTYPITQSLEFHCANTAATFTIPEIQSSWLRSGIGTYGETPGPAVHLPLSLRFIARVVCFVGTVRTLPAGATVGYGMTYQNDKPLRLATLTVGYADGAWNTIYDRTGKHVLIRGRHFPVVGRVSMDMITVDVTEGPDIVSGDEVVLIGEQGDASIGIHELAAGTGLMGYEVLSSFGHMLGP